MTQKERIEMLESIVEALLERNAMAKSVIFGLTDQVKNLQKRVAELEEDFSEVTRIFCNDFDNHTDRINDLDNSIQALTKMVKRNRNSIMEHI